MPSKGTRRRGFRLSDSTYAAAKQRADTENTNISAVVREHLEQYGATGKTPAEREETA